MALTIASNQTLILNARINGLQAAIANDEPVTLAQAQALVNRSAFKDDVRVKAPGNISIAAPGATIDGVTMASGDRVLLASQTTAIESGIYIWNGAAAAMTRSPDAANYDDMESAIVMVSEGTSTGTRWRQTGINGVIGSNALNFISDAATIPLATEAIAGVAQVATQALVDEGTNDAQFVTPLKLKNSPLAHRVTRLVIGDGVATSFSIPHTFATTDVDVLVKENSGSKRQIIVENDTPDANTARVIFAGAPAANSYVVLVTKKA
jgi:hypothetical protein